MNSFTQLLDQLDGQPDEIKSLRRFIKTKQVAKGTILLQKGEMGEYVFFVKEGLLRSYAIDQKGKEHIFIFAPEGWLISDGALEDEPSELYIDALEDSEIEVVSKDILTDQMIHLMAGNDKERIERLIKRIAVLQKRVIMLMSASAIERYEDFIKTYPEITQRVPQRMIASYLGITPEALSKVKSAKAKGK